MSNQSGYTIPKEIKAETIIKGRLTLRDLVIIAIFIILGFFISNIVNAGLILKIIIVIVHFVIGLIVTSKPRGNPDKSFYLVLLSMFRMDKKGYRSLDINKYNKKEVK